MSKELKELLAKYFVHVFYMLGHDAHNYSLKERTELAELTDALRVELEKEDT